VQFSYIVARRFHNDDMVDGSGDERASGVASKTGACSHGPLRRVRYTLTSMGRAIASPSADPAPLMKALTLLE
jgi:hypothetical protein